MKLFETMVNHKINRIQPSELLSIAAQYNVKLSSKQAEDITYILAGKNINIFDSGQRQTVLEQISAVTGKKTAVQIEHVFNQLISNF